MITYGGKIVKFKDYEITGIVKYVGARKEQFNEVIKHPNSIRGNMIKVGFMSYVRDRALDFI